MRTSPISIDMDFRIIPSTVPLQSPSPDRKSLNYITPTISPNTVEIKKNFTPINTKNYRYERYQKIQKYQKNIRQKQNNGLNQLERQTQAKYYTQNFHPAHSHFQTNSQIHAHNNSQNHNSMSQGNFQFTTVIKQKDQVIKNLKNVIQTMAQNNIYKKINVQQEKQLRNQVRILTIQNQKLVNIIQKITKKNNEINSHINTNSNTINNTNNSPTLLSIDSLNNTNTLQNAKITEQYEGKIAQLVKTMKENQYFYEEQTKEIKRFNKSLNTQCKNLQNANKDLEIQNKKLLKILKQKNQGEKIGNMKLSDSIQTNEPSQHQIATNKNQQKLTLMKIRQQHSQNLKMLKEGLIRQIQQTFDTMKIALEGMNSKVTALAKRLQSLEKMTWQRIRKAHTHTQTQTVTVTIKQLQPVAQIQPEGSGQTDRTFKPQKKNNSQIYIQQCPSSSHDKASRDQFSRMEQVASNKNLHHSFQQQLEAVKSQLIDLKIKYKKLRQDSSPSILSYSRSQTNTNRSEQVEFANLQQKYRLTRQQLDEKIKETNNLNLKIKQLESQNIQQIQKNNALILQNAANKNIFDNHVSQIKQKTQQQVEMLAQNYQKQLQILRKQNNYLKQTLQDQQPKTQVQRAELDLLSTKIQQLQEINQKLVQSNQKIQHELLTLQLKFQSEHKQLVIMSSNFENAQNQSEEHRKKKQQMQLELQFKAFQVNQIKEEAQHLKQELINKDQEIKLINLQSQELQVKYSKILQLNTKLNRVIELKQVQLNKVKELLKEIGYDGMLERIEEIQSLLKLKPSSSDQIQSSQQLIVQQIQEQNRIQRQKLQAEVQKLRNQLQERQQQIIRLQCQVSQLQKLEKVSKTRQQQLVTINKQSSNRINQLQKKLIYSEKIKTRQNQKIQKLLSQKEDFERRLDDIKKIQKQRIKTLRVALENRNQDQNKEQFHL